jgi:hypothetical protein
MLLVKAFALGMVALAVLGYTVVTVAAMAAASAGREIEMRLGPIVVVTVDRVAAGTETTYGAGLLLVALLGGALNAAAAAVLAWRRARRAPVVSR